jgi:hypothetical protein
VGARGDLNLIVLGGLISRGGTGGGAGILGGQVRVPGVGAVEGGGSE